MLKESLKDYGISEEEKNEMMIFLQGAVFALGNFKENDEFTFRDLMGRNNRDWDGTPLQKLYDKIYDYFFNEKGESKEEAHQQAYVKAPMEAGKLLAEIAEKMGYETIRDTNKHNRYRRKK
ncbi:hypothetical protein [Bergeyella zoohelcum]|uniref:Uncharacterized protein n=1 Tax=Bergeyella zoohelcum TaxID=1015 RepID=A0A380ZTW8_9FLAO|nr:hypothetical protein [Bergeyella zoohelcum]EKB59843.1 hypothetical protein HMPREF9700_01349 [Bergeyella zoohelcum CCUG 30536]SUV52787.1 Uncharacterised protein [Bergeyella zoohelcum]